MKRVCGEQRGRRSLISILLHALWKVAGAALYLSEHASVIKSVLLAVRTRSATRIRSTDMQRAQNIHVQTTSNHCNDALPPISPVIKFAAGTRCSGQPGVFPQRPLNPGARGCLSCTQLWWVHWAGRVGVGLGVGVGLRGCVAAWLSTERRTAHDAVRRGCVCAETPTTGMMQQPRPRVVSTTFYSRPRRVVAQGGFNYLLFTSTQLLRLPCRDHQIHASFCAPSTLTHTRTTRHRRFVLPLSRSLEQGASSEQGVSSLLNCKDDAGGPFFGATSSNRIIVSAWGLAHHHRQHHRRQVVVLLRQSRGVGG